MSRKVSRRSFNFGLPLALSAGYGAIAHSKATATPSSTLSIPSTISHPTSIASNRVRNLNDLLEVKRTEHGLPAVTAVTLSQGQIVAKGETGVRKAGTSTIVRPADRWHIGSCTKAMTATLIGALVERGTLSWNTTLYSALPSLREQMISPYRNVTVEMLLGHRAGLPRGHAVPAAWRYTWRREDSAVTHRHTVSAMMLKNEPIYTPGRGYNYSNMGYCIAGHIAEVVTGQPWESLIQSFVFEPLGITSAGPGPTHASANIESPWGHQRNSTPIAPSAEADHPDSFSPGGGNLHISMTDWSRFVAEHLKGARGEHGRILRAATYDRLHRGGPTGDGGNYALGWGVTQRPWARGNGGRGTCLSHCGTILSWYSQVWVAPERNMAVMCATNIGDRNREGAVSISDKLDDVVSSVISEELNA
ncbi:MAG: serine hydrolase domain-containing protein [Cyanobacteria bacterium P01_D01_bin.36]